MNILVLGAGGMAGHLIAAYLQENGCEITAVARRDLKLFNTIKADLRDSHLLEKIVKSQDFDAVINCVGLLNASAENFNYYSFHLTADRRFRLQVY